mmetsp:Transcript_15953/g.50747  ORF Transcript_15953/g.50747 Transcript_15953/m.50747 type:complete len:511 (+) Transcript_15953:448-1980(+)
MRPAIVVGQEERAPPHVGRGVRAVQHVRVRIGLCRDVGQAPGAHVARAAGALQREAVGEVGLEREGRVAGRAPQRHHFGQVGARLAHTELRGTQLGQVAQLTTHDLPQHLLGFRGQALLDELPPAGRVLCESLVRQVSGQRSIGEGDVRVAAVRRHRASDAALPAGPLPQVVHGGVVHVRGQAAVAREVGAIRAFEARRGRVLVRSVAQAQAAGADSRRTRAHRRAGHGLPRVYPWRGGRQHVEQGVGERLGRGGSVRWGAPGHGRKQLPHGRRRVRQHLIEGRAQRKHIRRPIGCSVLSRPQLGRNVPIRPPQREGVRDTRGRVQGDIEIGQPRPAGVVDQDVVGLDVTMHHAVGVQVRHRAGQGVDDGRGSGGGWPSCAPPLAQRAVLVEGHLNVHRRVRVGHVAEDRLDRHDRRVTQPHQQRRLLVARPARRRVHRILFKHHRPAIQLPVPQRVPAGGPPERPQVGVYFERALRVEDGEQLARRRVGHQGSQFRKGGQAEAQRHVHV